METCKHTPGGDNHVLDSRPRAEYIWRRRKCNKCNVAFTTIEITDERMKALTTLEENYSEADHKTWAVIDANGIQHSGLTLSQAQPLAKSCGAGSIIVSIATAYALKKQGDTNGNTSLRQEREDDESERVDDGVETSGGNKA